MNAPADKNDFDTDFERRAASMLRERAASLDASTRSRLNRARQAALDELPGARRARYARQGWAVAAAASVALLAAALWTNRPLPESAPLADAPAAATDLELLMAGEELEMLEDLEFFAWLDPEDLAETGGAAG